MHEKSDRYSHDLLTGPVAELAYACDLESYFWEFESLQAHHFAECNVSLVDGLLWKQEAESSNLSTPTNYIKTNHEKSNW